MTEVRVRFAPSPTGYLHLGGARSALYNWLWARKTGGKLILRIEDTDRARSTEENTEIVLASMRWLGLDWDEGPEVGGPHGPYFQMERLDIYAEHARRLVESGAAYRCYATKEEMQAAREQWQQKTGRKEGFRFESPWRDRNEERDEPHVIRLKAPREGSIAWDDRVKGRLEYPNDQMQDVVLVRTDGVPLYNFGAVVDDITMGITLVARGDDHMINTPIQILLYQALGAEVPEFAHMPMILGPDGQKLSKRHAAVAVLEYRDEGYVPDGVINYLARLGWSHGDQEVFTRDELIEKFDWEHVGKSGAKYDKKKFEHVQAEHLRATPDAELAELAVPFLALRDVKVSADDPRLLAAIPYVKPRATTLADVAHAVEYFLKADIQIEDKGRRKFLKQDKAAPLRKLKDMLASVDRFDVATLEPAIHQWMEDEGLTFKDWAQSARVALTGRTASPGIIEVMEVLGKDRTLERLEAGARLAETPEEG